MKIVFKAPKVRNPYVLLAFNRKSGPHSKTNKAQRRSDKVKIKIEIYSTEGIVNFF